ncbi:MAG TPA: type II secretion system secretin GspD [Candidatus Binatia bacterium]
MLSWTLLPTAIDAQQEVAPDMVPPPPPAAESGDDAIVLNFEKADIREVVHSLAGALGINYLLDPRVEGQVTIRTTGRIPRSELFPIFNQILRSIGIAAVKVGEVYNIMPIAEAKTRAPVKDTAAMRADDLFVVELVTVKNVAAQEMVNLLEPFITPGGDVFAYPRANVLIITDIATNVERLREMVQLLDRDSFKELKAKVFKIEHANIEDLGQELLAVLDTYGITGEAAAERGVYVIPLLRLNSIAVLAFNDDMFEAVDYWMKLLDVPPDDELTRTVRVYNVQNAKAADLAVVLNELYGGGEGTSRNGGGPGAPQRGQPGFGGAGGLRGFGGGGGGGFGGAASSTGGRTLGGGRSAGAGLGRTQQLGSSGGLGSSGSRGLGSSGRSGLGRRSGAQPAGVLGGTPGGSISGGGASGFVITGGEGPLSMFQNEVRIVADEIANSIVILATKRDYEQILKVLRELDVVPRQVVIEVLIAEVSLNKDMKLGLQSVITNPGSVNAVPTPQPTSTAGPTPTNGDMNGTASLLNSVLQDTASGDLKRFIEIIPNASNNVLTAVISDNSSFKLTLTALAAANRLKVLASPHILTADNREASIHIGTEIPILTSQANIAGIQTAGGQTALVNSVQYRSTGVILTVLPQVNADGLVNLQVRQEVSEVGADNFGGTGSPSFTTREAETTAVVQNGDSLLIGGIIQETSSRSRSGVPYLMDIPVIGRMFRFDDDSVRRVELIVLLTPHVIRNRSESLLVTEEYKDRLWDVVDEIERTSGLKPPSKAERAYINRLRSRSTTAQRPTEGMLPNRESSY